MNALSMTRKSIIGVILIFWIGVFLPWHVRAEPMGPALIQTLMAGGGRYVIANYTGPYFVIWDLESIWDRHQPTQVLVVQRGIGDYTHSMGIALSQDGTILAFQDWGLKKILLCEMEIHFPCHSVLEFAEALTSMEVSTLGEQLLLLTPTKLRLLATKTGKLQSVPLATTGKSCLAVNWRSQLAAVGSLDGSLHVLDLKGLKIIDTTRQKPAASCQLFFSNDGKHLYVNWVRESVEGGILVSHQSVEHYDISQTAINQIRVEEDVYIVPGDQAGELWYVTEVGDGVLILAPINPQGGLLTGDGARIVAGPLARVQAVGSAKNIILLLINDTHFVYDLRSSMPIASLYASKVGYIADGKSLPHLTPGMGADPAYQQLEILGRSYSMGLPLDYYTFPSDDMEKNRKNALLWLATLVAQRGDRYDSVWFDLLPVYRQEKEARRAYYQLMTLCRLLIQLNYAEYLLNGGQYEQAFLVSRDALQSLRDTPELQYQLGDLDNYNPNLSSLVLHYRTVLERDLWLALGNSLSYQGAFQKAELAFRGALRSDPREWKAYEGILRTRLGGDPAILSAAIAESQQALELEYWNGFGPIGFFKEDDIFQLGKSELTFPGSNLNWVNSP